MPLPVIGALLVYSICYMVMTGMEVMMSRMMDTRRFFTIGISLIFGLGISTIANLALPLDPSGLATNFTSPIILATTIAIGLTLIFRIGITQQVSIRIMPGDQDLSSTVFSFIDLNARKWGARRDVAHRAGSALVELLESGFMNGIIREDAKVSLSFDEYNLDMFIEYQGEQVDIPSDMPSHEEILNNPEAFLQMSLALVRFHSDGFTVSRNGDSNRAHIHFEH